VTRAFAMHQPNYLPWLGYFDKMRRVDVFVLLDTVQYPRGASVANRNVIRQGTSEVRLTVPVAVPKGNEGKASYRDVTFADTRWQAKHLRTLEQAYRRAPFFEPMFPELRELVEPAGGFCDMTVEMIRWHARRFGIETSIVLQSELPEGGSRNQLIADLAAALECDVYVSGSGAAAYNDAEWLAERGIELRYQQFEHPLYAQLGECFQPNLAAVDALFCCGGWPAGG
jgi:WbqC-like protein family